MTEETPLYRQIHPNFIKQDENGEEIPSSEAFKPSSKDNKTELSVYDGDQISAEDAHRHYTETWGLSSGGSYAVLVKKCEDLGLTAKPDPEPFPEHALIMFPPDASQKRRKRIAKSLRDSGSWAYRP